MLELLILFAVMVAQVIIPPIPAEMVVVFSAKFHGVWTTTAVAGAGLFVGGVLVYFIGRFIHKGFEKTFQKEKVQRVITRLHEVETPILLVRVLPYNPSDVISYAAGVIGINLKKFVTITFFVSFIRVYILAYFGSKISDIKTLFMVFGALFISAVIGWIVVFGTRKKRA
ncbi:MAG: TVP38/TMEM64 family protein [Campylobacterota bacterium]